MLPAAELPAPLPGDARGQPWVTEAHPGQPGWALACLGVPRYTQVAAIGARSLASLTSLANDYPLASLSKMLVKPVGKNRQTDRPLSDPLSAPVRPAEWLW
jgi:hypothetical protein